jgi:hypothetical protein
MHGGILAVLPRVYKVLTPWYIGGAREKDVVRVLALSPEVVG